MTGFATPSTPPELPEELTLWLTRVVAYWAGELTPPECERFEAELPGLSHTEREIYDEVRVLFESLTGEVATLKPSRDLWAEVRATVQTDLAWLTAVRRASGEAAVPETSERALPVACEPAPQVQASVETVFAVTAAAEPLVPSRDLLAPLRAEVMQTTPSGMAASAPNASTQAHVHSAESRAHLHPAGRLTYVRNWLGAGVTATVAAAAALMLAVGLGLLEPPGGNETAPGGADSDGSSPSADESPKETAQDPPPQEEEETSPGQGATHVDGAEEGYPPQRWSQPFAPAFISFELDPNRVSPGEPAYEPLPAQPQEIRFFATKVEQWPLAFDMPEPPSRLVLGKGIEGARLALPTTEGNLHLRRARERGVLEIYQDNEPNRRTIIRSDGTVDVMLRRYRDGGRREVLPYSVRFYHDAEFDTWYAMSASMMVSHSTVAGRRLVLVDADVNGRFDDIGTDFVYFVDSPAAIRLAEHIALGSEVIQLSVDPSGLNAQVASYRGSTGELVVRGDYRDGVNLEYLHLRSAQTSLLVEPHMLGETLQAPPGHYELVYGRVGDGSGSVWVNTFEMRDRGELVGVGKHAPSPAAAPAVTLYGSQEQAAPSTFVLGGELSLTPFHVHTERTQLKQIPLQLALLGRAGERYLPVENREPRPLLPDEAEVRAASTGKRLGEAGIEPTASSLLPFIADLRARGVEPEAEHTLRLVEREVSERLRGAPSEAVVPLR